MRKTEGLRIEPLGNHPEICVLRGHRGEELGTGSREVLEVLLWIVEKCDQAQQKVSRPLTKVRAATAR
jgi:hypothetical protein